MEHLHTIVIFIIIAIVIYFQLKSYRSTTEKLSIFKNIFPGNTYGISVEKNINNTVVGIESTHKNPVMNIIRIQINNYLQNNQGAVSDFHIIKDIVDRNYDSKEEEISTQIPIPLYFGLMGTMAGILLGIGYLVITEGLNELINGSTSAIDASSIDASGINALLEGVALAMITSILGIILTTYGSVKLKESKVESEQSKNNFLSWIQAKLLPQLASDTTGVLQQVTRNLSSFNQTFSGNTKELRETLTLVNEAYKDQTQVLEAINGLQINKIAAANVQVYDKLQNCTNEIGQFAEYFQSVNQYIADVRKLNHKLDDHENRTKALEKMGDFFEQEKERISALSGINSKVIAQIETHLTDVVGKVKTNIGEQFNELGNHTIKQREKFEKIAEEQQDALAKRSEELAMLTEELKQLSAVKKSLDTMGEASKAQNQKLDKLANSISELAQLKTLGGSSMPSIKIPMWVKISAIGIGALLVLPNIIFLVQTLLSLFKN